MISGLIPVVKNCGEILAPDNVKIISRDSWLNYGWWMDPKFLWQPASRFHGDFLCRFPSPFFGSLCTFPTPFRVRRLFALFCLFRNQNPLGDGAVCRKSAQIELGPIWCSDCRANTPQEKKMARNCAQPQPHSVENSEVEKSLFKVQKVMAKPLDIGFHFQIDHRKRNGKKFF